MKKQFLSFLACVLAFCIFSSTACLTVGAQTVSDCISVEIMQVETMVEEEDGYYNPNITIKLTYADGSCNTYTSYVRDDMTEWIDGPITITHSQKTTPWTVGGENLFTVTCGNVSDTASVVITPLNDYEYIYQNGGLIITACNINEDTISVPSEISGREVIGVTSLDPAINNAKHVIIPDSVTHLTSEIFSWRDIETLSIGKNVSYIRADAFANCNSLKAIEVSPDNATYSDIDGVLYNKAGDTLVTYPLGKGNTYTVPANVIDINMLYEPYYRDITVTFENGSSAYKTVDSVTYSADMTKLISCPKDKTGAFSIPQSVTEIVDYAFSGCTCITSVTIPDSVTDVAYCSFEGCTALENVSLPKNLKSVQELTPVYIYLLNLHWKTTVGLFPKQIHGFGTKL